LIVVSDTSPIRALDFLGLLAVLDDLFDGVLIPPAVKVELDSPLSHFDVVDLSKFDFIVVQAPHDQDRVQQFLRTLDRGESEALALALETGTRLILMDERRGRAAAAQHGIVALGALGVLLRAKSRGIIPAIRPLIVKLDELEFFMSDELKNNVLRLAGE
jgi:predicted nucleic acid-binding protein